MRAHLWLSATLLAGSMSACTAPTTVVEPDPSPEQQDNLEAFGCTEGVVTRDNAAKCYRAALTEAAGVLQLAPRESQLQAKANAIADLASVQTTANGLCDALRGVFGSNDPTGAAFTIGGSVGVSTGFVDVGAGLDQLWDLYHYQLVESVIVGYGFSSFTFGPTAQAFGGLAFNFKQNAGEWFGWFQGAGITIPIPEIPFLQVGASVFASAADQDRNGIPEVLVGNGVFGGVGTLTAAIPTPAWLLPGWVNRLAKASTISKNGAGIGIMPNFYTPDQDRMAADFAAVTFSGAVKQPLGTIAEEPASGAPGYVYHPGSNFSPNQCWQGDKVCAIEFPGSFHWSRGGRMAGAMARIVPGQGSSLWATFVAIPAAYGALRSLGGAMGDAYESICGAQQ